MSTVHTKSHDGILLHMKWLSSYLLVEVAWQMTEGIYKMKAPCICTLTLLVKSKQFFLFRWALFTDSSTFIKQKQVGFRLSTICFFIESFTVSCNENKIFAKTCKDLQRLASDQNVAYCYLDSMYTMYTMYRICICIYR